MDLAIITMDLAMTDAMDLAMDAMVDWWVTGLELSRQTYLFQLFSDTLDSLVMRSRAEGAYDEGICEIKGRVLTFEGDPEVRTMSRGFPWYWKGIGGKDEHE